jgi:thioredoxin-related protein
MSKRLLGFLILIVPLLITGQLTNKIRTEAGVKWTIGLTWEQIKQKAKVENKYIFLDCFTTWCGPCKMMDMQVYGNDSVGNYINDHFVAVKVQMDKTKRDGEEVQRWYDDVATINQEYHVTAYPTFIFLSPKGTIVDKQIGFKEVNDFIVIAQNVVLPGKVYNDPYADYNRFIREYKEGKKDYDHYPLMITIANRLKENDLFKQLTKELSAYVATLPRKKRYTKERIEMWNQFTFTSNSQVFRFFYQEGKLIDKVMEQKGYANKFVDRTIESEIIAPFFDEQNKNPSIAMSGSYVSDATGKSLVRFDSSEADWSKLKVKIRNKFSREYATRNVLKARMEWYKRHGNWLPYLEYTLEYLNSYWSLKYDGPWGVNSYAWEAFLFSTDKKIINEYIKWMERAVTNSPDYVPSLDTYANLLYKAGRIQEGIQWESKAMRLVDEKHKKLYKDVIAKMQKGVPTYDAIWICR